MSPVRRNIGRENGTPIACVTEKVCPGCLKKVFALILCRSYSTPRRTGKKLKKRTLRCIPGIINILLCKPLLKRLPGTKTKQRGTF